MCTAAMPPSPTLVHMLGFLTCFGLLLLSARTRPSPFRPGSAVSATKHLWVSKVSCCCMVCSSWAGVICITLGTLSLRIGAQRGLQHWFLKSSLQSCFLPLLHRSRECQDNYARMFALGWAVLLVLCSASSRPCFPSQGVLRVRALFAYAMLQHCNTRLSSCHCSRFPLTHVEQPSVSSSLLAIGW